jgi:hypothetical protein
LLASDPRGLSLPTHLRFSDGFGGPIVRTKTGKPGGTKAKPTVEFTRRVCHGCNNGWMNRVDIAAMPFLSKMMRGELLMLDPDAQSRLAAWICKLTVVARFAHLRLGLGDVPAPVARSWLDWLYSRHTALPHWHVWLARYDGSEPFIYSGEDVRISNFRKDGHEEVLVAHGAYASIVLGYLAIQVFGVDEEATLLDPCRDPYFVSSIWPARATSVKWPPPLKYTDANILGFLHRLVPRVPLPRGAVDAGYQIDWATLAAMNAPDEGT